MSFLNVAIMLAILGLGMVASMLYYGSRGKKKMREGFDRLAAGTGGTVEQPTRMHYPRLTAEVDGRPVTLQVHLSEGHRKTSDIIYLVLSTPARVGCATLVVREGYFAAAPERAGFNDVAGDYLEGLLPGRYVYADDEAATHALLGEADVGAAVPALAEGYPSLVLGPDAVTAGKPYGGATDLLPERLLPEFAALTALAAALERAAPGAKAAKGSKAPAATRA
jgi:hypothetical protein